MLSTEAMSAAHVAYGTIVNDIREVSRSYKEAKMALDVGKFLQQQECCCLQQIRNRPSYISASYTIMSDVH